MPNPAENITSLVNALVSLLQDIPGLVTLVGSDTDNIFAYLDAFPNSCSLQHAIQVQPSPSVMVAWQSTGKGARGGFPTYRHEISVILRTNTVADFPTLCGYVTQGTPTSKGLPMDVIEVHSSCDPMEDLPTVERQSDSEGIDYFVVSMAFQEK
jgi:hypothetical protein